MLLVAGAATREYQFVRNLLAREADQGRVKLAVYLQTPPGRTEPREGVVQTATLLKKFPEVTIHSRPEDIFGGDQPDEMASYDVVVAFDPDWAQLNEDQQKLLKGWVEDGGGLVVVAGPVNTGQLGKKADADKFKSVLDLYPIVPKAARTEEATESDKAFALHFPAGDKSPKFMQLDAESKSPVAGWEAFFFGDKEEHKLERGFYEVFPVDSVKPDATVLATLADPKAKLADGKEAPFLVTASAGKGRVVYLGSGEMWRLRSYREAFHDRFWTELVRYAAPATK